VPTPSQSSAESSGSFNKALGDFAKNIDQRLRTLEGNLYTTFIFEKSASIPSAMLAADQAYWDSKPSKGTPHPNGHVKNMVLAAMLKSMSTLPSPESEEMKAAYNGNKQIMDNLHAELMKCVASFTAFTALDPHVDWCSAKATKTGDKIVVKVMLSGSSAFKPYWELMLFAMRCNGGEEKHGAAPPGPQVRKLLALIRNE